MKRFIDFLVSGDLSNLKEEDLKILPILRLTRALFVLITLIFPIFFIYGFYQILKEIGFIVSTLFFTISIFYIPRIYRKISTLINLKSFGEKKF